MIKYLYTILYGLKCLINYCNAKREYKRDVKTYKGLTEMDEKFIYQKSEELPMIKDKYEEAGTVDAHYFLQDLYMAKEVLSDNPKEHYDIGSRVDGFISHLLAAGKGVTMIDIRPFSYKVEGLKFVQGNAINLESVESNSIGSLSSLHAVEHFGLGRYGDPIDPAAWKKALMAMQRVLKVGGKLYISVPIGTRDVLKYNAHRIFEIHTIPGFLEQCELVKVAYIENYRIYQIKIEEFPAFTLNTQYACGMYIFRKKDKV